MGENSLIDNGELDNYKKVETVTPIEDWEISFLLKGRLDMAPVTYPSHPDGLRAIVAKR